MPLTLLALHAYYQDGRRRWLALFGASWLLQALTNGYYMFFFPVLLGAWVAFFTPGASGRGARVMVALTWVLFEPPLGARSCSKYYSVQQAQGLRGRGRRWRCFCARLDVVSQSRAAAALLAERQVDDAGGLLFPGVFVIALVRSARSPPGAGSR